MEAVWAAALAWGASQRETRPFALVLALKWALNYATFLWVHPWAHMAVDLGAGTALVVMAGSLPVRRWKDVIAAAAALTMVAHAALVITWATQPKAGVLHFGVVIALYTVQTCALTLPTGADLARRAWRRIRGAGAARRRVAGLAARVRLHWRTGSED